MNFLVAIPALLASTKALRDGLTQVTEEIDEISKNILPNDQDAFVSTMSEFVKTVEFQISFLEKQTDLVNEKIANFLTFFGEDPVERKDAPQDVFGIFPKFDSMVKVMERH